MTSKNFSQVLQLGEGDEAFINTFIEQSTGELANYLSCIKEGIETKNLYWLNFIKHKSKTLLELLSDEMTSKKISTISELASKGQWELDHQLESLEKEIYQLIENIKTQLQTQEV
jgi:hypothetical protein